MAVSLSDLKGRRGARKIFKQIPPMMIIREDEWGPIVTTEEGRYYTTPTGKTYQSVTTFLGRFEDESWKEKWIAGLAGGVAEADAISQRACDRGELVHKVLEQYVTNDPTWNELDANQFRFMFNQIRRALDKKLDGVLYSEHALYSDELQIAGRVDLCGLWNGILSIIDFKNKNRLSKREDIEDYFIQCCIYAIMHRCCYGVLPEKLVVLLAIEDHCFTECQVMEENTRDWIPKVLDLVRRYKAGDYPNK